MVAYDALDPQVWSETIQLIRRRQTTIQTVREFMRAMAGLGGFLGRKADGEPG
jgi:hypothetical protein